MTMISCCCWWVSKTETTMNKPILRIVMMKTTQLRKHDDDSSNCSQEFPWVLHHRGYQLFQFLTTSQKLLPLKSSTYGLHKDWEFLHHHFWANPQLWVGLAANKQLYVACRSINSILAYPQVPVFLLTLLVWVQNVFSFTKLLRRGEGSQ